MSKYSLRLAPLHEFHGPNPFAPGPAIVMRATLEHPDVDERQALADVRLACDRMAEAFPDWFAQMDLAAATAVLLAARAVACCTLGMLNEWRGFIAEAGAVESGDGAARVWAGFHTPSATAEAFGVAAAWFAKALESASAAAAFQSTIAAFFQRLAPRHPDYQTCVLLRGARSGDIPVVRVIPLQKLWQFGWGARARLFSETLSNDDGALASVITQSKPLSKAVFERLGLPTPRAKLVRVKSELAEAVRYVGWPCVLKPQDLGGGRGVTANIRTPEQLHEAFALARRHSAEALLLEAHMTGEDHRLMVIEGRFTAAIRREPSSVTGDGRSTIAQLVAALNATRSMNMVKSRYLRPIQFDDAVRSHLASLGWHADSVLRAGETVRLRSNANLSTGGICIDVTDRIHPDTRRMAEMLAETMGMANAGLDYITPDISRPWKEAGAFIEMNTTPGIDAMIAAGQDPVHLALQTLGGKPGRIPVRVVLYAAPDRDAVSACIQSRPQPAGCGWAGAGHIKVDGVLLTSRGVPRAAVEAVLLNRCVQEAVFFCAADELQASGFPVDKAGSAVLCGPADLVPPAWLEVVRRCARRLEHVADWAAFASRESWSS